MSRGSTKSRRYAARQNMKQKGMTLVESVVVLAITAIISGIVLVAYTYVSNRQLDTNARTIVADLVWAREMAVSMHRSYTVRFSTGQNWYRVYNGSVAPANEVKYQRCSRGIHVANVTNDTGVNLIQTKFNFTAHTGIPVTNPAGQYALINLTQNYRVRMINISSETGFITIDP